MKGLAQRFFLYYRGKDEFREEGTPPLNPLSA
jgi:hypothetical protein